MDKEFPCVVVQKPVDEAALVAAGARAYWMAGSPAAWTSAAQGNAR
jgi:hypothetical protein